jgi:hypothetical protein
MKKVSSKEDTDQLRSEYDLSKLKGGVRGKYYQGSKDHPPEPVHFPPKGVSPPDEIILNTRREYLSEDFQMDTDVQELIELMFDDSECKYFYFKSQTEPPNEFLKRALEGGKLLMPKYEDYYYLRPGTERSFVKIGPHTMERLGERSGPINQGQRYFRITLTLSERTKRKLQAHEIAETAITKDTNPFELKPNLWGVGLDLTKAYRWIKQHLQKRK